MGLIATAAPAEVGFSLTAASDDRFRGTSTSDHLPVGTFAISYDDTSGVYGGASATVGPVRDAGVRVLRSVQYIGFAHRITPLVALDIGISNHLYDRRATVEYSRRFAQFYAGVNGRRVSTHIFYAPDYDGRGNAAGYARVDALLFERGRLSMTGRIGALRLPRSARYGRPLDYDWQLGIARRLHRSASIGLDWVGGGREAERTYPARQARSTLLLVASQSF